MASGRMQRWALLLAGYRYTLVYRQGLANANADALSRLPTAAFPSETRDPFEAVLSVHILESTNQPVTTSQMRRWTERDPVLAKVLHYVLSGWPREIEDPSLQPYCNRRYELSVLEGCILWGARVVVPPQARERVLHEIHTAHPGSSRMKSLARSYIWWPKLDQTLERVAKMCDRCQEHKKAPPEAPLHPWVNPGRPWARLHIDFADPFLGKWFLVLVDAFSKWLEIHPMNAATSRATVKVLQSVFATHGLPHLIVTDNGSVFTSAEFGDLMKGNGISHVTAAPYHPASNGLAERAVQTFKEATKKMEKEYGSVESKVDRFLFTYRLTPHATTGEAPAVLLMGRRPRSRLDILHPDLAQKMLQRQQQQKIDHDKTCKDRSFEEGQPVFTRNFGKGPRWLPGVILERTGPVSFCIQLKHGGVVRRHQDQVRSRLTDPDDQEEAALRESAEVTPPSPGRREEDSPVSEAGSSRVDEETRRDHTTMQ